MGWLHIVLGVAPGSLSSEASQADHCDEVLLYNYYIRDDFF